MLLHVRQRHLKKKSHGEWLTKEQDVLDWISENTEKVRARNSKGHYIKDDPTTPENEAWITKIKKKIKSKTK